MSRTRRNGVSPADLAPCRGFLTELLMSCGRGETVALGHLVDVYRPHVVSALMLVDDGASKGDQEEFVLQAFLEVWRRCPTYRPAQQSALEWLGEVLCGALGARRQPVVSVVRHVGLEPTTR